jgi:hypothetical protein
MPWKDSPYKGVRYRIVFWLDEDGACHVEAFLLGLIGGNDPDAVLMDRLLDRTAHHGPPQNETKFRFLKSKGKGLVEFKARGGARILGFIDQDNRRIVCTHGIPKLEGKKFDRWVDRAREVKESYLLETTPEEGTNYVQ